MLLLNRRYSLDEYLAIAETAVEKCEYHDGGISAITGGTLNHSVNVLSPSTEEYDRTDKFRKYRSIPRSWEYLLASSKRSFCGAL